jgi:hypothetical protein
MSICAPHLVNFLHSGQLGTFVRERKKKIFLLDFFSRILSISKTGSASRAGPAGRIGGVETAALAFKFGTHPSFLCCVASADGTQNPAMGHLASFEQATLCAKAPAREYSVIEQADRLGGLGACTPREPRFSQCSSCCFFPHLPCWQKPRRRIARSLPVRSARSFQRSVTRWRSRPTRRSRRAAEMGPMHRRSGIISKGGNMPG